jgi:hypothetical protein
MNTKTFAILGAAAALAVGLAVLVARSGSAPADDARLGDRMFDTLALRANDAALIRVTRSGGEFSVRRDGEQWGIVEKGGYPVMIETVRGAIVGLSELRTGEPMTSRPDRYPQIGVQDLEAVEGEDHGFGGPTLITIEDGDGAQLASAIVGNARATPRPGVYIRRPGEAQSWLAEGRLELPGRFTNWIQPQIISIPRDRIQSVDVAPPGEDPFSVVRPTREERSFTVIGVPDGHELKSTTAADAFGNALSFVSLEDVAPAGAIAGAVPGSHLQFRTFDGLLVMVELFQKQGTTWARLAAAHDPDAEPAQAVIDEAATLDAGFEGWIFALPEYKASVMKVTMLDLIQDGRPFELPASMQEEGIEMISLDPPEHQPPPQQQP